MTFVVTLKNGWYEYSSLIGSWSSVMSGRNAWNACMSSGDRSTVESINASR